MNVKPLEFDLPLHYIIKENERKHWDNALTRATFGDIITWRRAFTVMLFEKMYYGKCGNVHGWDTLRDCDLSLNWVYHGPNSVTVGDIDFY